MSVDKRLVCPHLESVPMAEAPWNRGQWHGSIVSVDGTDTTDTMHDQSCIGRVIAWGTTRESDWDGECAGVVQLVDGRYCSWSSGWGPTGSGFSKDAYGGDAGIFVASTALGAIQALSERDLELMGFAVSESEYDLIAVLCDEIERSASRPRLLEIAAASGEFGALFVYRIDDIVRRWRPLTAVEDACA